MSKYPKTLGRIEAVWNKLGGEAGVDRFLRDELSVSEPTRSWCEKDGVIYLPPLVSDGTMGPLWIPRLEKKGFRVGDYAKQVLRSPDFKPTNGVTTEVAILKGVLFKDDDRITKNIRAKAYTGIFTQGRKLFDPNAEMACLIREKFTDEDIEAMGLWYIVAMPEHINDSDGAPFLLSGSRNVDGRWLDACSDRPDSRWDRVLGVA